MGLTAGLLGGIRGAAGAVNQLSGERLKQLAEQLRMQALETIQKRRDEREQGYAQERAGTRMDFDVKQQESRQVFQKGQGLLERKSRMDITKAQTGSAEDRNKANNDVKKELAKNKAKLDREILKMNRDTLAFKQKKLQSDTLGKAIKYFRDTGDADGANAMLEGINHPKRFIDIKVGEEKVGGFLGIGGEMKDITEPQLKDTSGKPVTGLGTAITADDTVDKLLAEAKKAEAAARRGTGTKEKGLLETGQGENILPDRTQDEDALEELGLPEEKGDTGVTAKTKAKYKGWTFTVDADGTIHGTPPGGGFGTTMKKPEKTTQIRKRKRTPGKRGRGLSVLETGPNPKYKTYMELLKLAQSAK